MRVIKGAWCFHKKKKKGAWCKKGKWKECFIIGKYTKSNIKITYGENLYNSGKFQS
jgi:hypothetical protein